VLRCKRPLRIPRVAALAIPGAAADVPRQVLISARGYDDELTVRMELDSFAQGGVANARRPGLPVLCEVKERAAAAGRAGLESLDFDAHVQAERNHAAV